MATAQCPRCESDHTRVEPGDVVSCDICSAQFTYTPPAPYGKEAIKAHRLAHLLRSLCANTAFPPNFDQPPRLTPTGAELTLRDRDGTDYRITIDPR